MINAEEHLLALLTDSHPIAVESLWKRFNHTPFALYTYWNFIDVVQRLETKGVLDLDIRMRDDVIAFNDPQKIVRIRYGTNQS
jgi:hypothetical protein